VFEPGGGADVITDFEHGVDAIEFLIQSFGFEDLSIIQDGEDALITSQAGSVRLIAVDGTTLSDSDFIFHLPG